MKNEKMKSLMNWSKENYSGWNMIIFSTQESIELFEIVKLMYKESMFDLAYLFINRTETEESEKIIHEINIEVYEELWGEKAQEEYLKRYISKMEALQTK